MGQSSDELSGFLSRQSVDGVRVNGHGEFTISPDKAWHKMGALAVPFPEVWILEIVRAAVLAQCSEVSVTQAREIIEVTLYGASWDEDAVSEGLANIPSAAAGQYRHLGNGLRILAKNLGHSFQVKQGDHEILSWNGRALLVNATGKRKGFAALRIRVNNSKCASTDRWAPTRRYGIDERGFLAGLSKALHSRAFGCPIALKLDSRPITGLHAHPQFAPSQTCQPLFYFQLPPNGGLPSIQVRELSSWQTVDKERPISIVGCSASDSSREVKDFPHDAGRADAEALVLISVFLKQITEKKSFFPGARVFKAWGPQKATSRLVWLQDGIVIDQEELHSGGFAMLVAASAEGLKTDLSGYKLVQDDQFAARRAHILSATARHVLASIDPEGLRYQQKVSRTFFERVLGTVGTIVGLGCFVIPGLIVMAEVEYGEQKAQRLSLDCQARFMREFRDFLARLETMAETGFRSDASI